MGSSKIDKKEIEKLIALLETIPIIPDVSPENFGYDNPVLICMDAVLSINRKYENFVVPRISSFKATYSNINNLSLLIDFINKSGRNNFCDVWNYKHLERVDILYNIASWFLLYKNKKMITKRFNCNAKLGL